MAKAVSKTAKPLITIPVAEYENLCDAWRRMNALQEAGVDNWEGYSFAMELMEDDDG